MRNKWAVARSAATLAVLWGAMVGGGVARGTLIAHWKLQDNAATSVVVDEIGSSNGTLAGYGGAKTSDVSTTGPGGAYPLAMDFNGTSYISTPFTSSLGDFTVCIWARITGGLNTARVVDKSYDTGFWIGRTSVAAANSVAFGIRETSSPYATNVSATDSTWNHLALTRSGTSKNIYVNGALLSTTSVSGTATSTDAFYLASMNTVGNKIIGKLADARIYDSALDATAIAAIVAEVTGGGGGGGSFMPRVIFIGSLLQPRFNPFRGTAWSARY